MTLPQVIRGIRCRPGIATRVVGVVLLVASMFATRPSVGDDLDLLVTPDAPGFVLLGTEPTSVQRPGTVADFTLTALSATENLGQIPQNYALVVAPFWLSKAARSLTYERYAQGGNTMGAVLQTLSLSVATASTETAVGDTGGTGVGIGLRFSLVRGPIDPEFDGYAKKLAAIRAQLADLSAAVNETSVARQEQDPELKSLKGKRDQETDPKVQALLTTLIGTRRDQIDQEVEAQIRRDKEANLETIEKEAAGLRVRRSGWQVDCAGGVALDFPGREFRDGDVSRTGFWVTIGYEGSPWTLLSVVRVLDDRATDRSNFDVGGRLLLQGSGTWSASAEGLYRSFPNTDMAPDGRLALVVERAIGPSRSITFTFGRGFEGSPQGSLLATLGLVLGFGTDRPIP